MTVFDALSSRPPVAISGPRLFENDVETDKGSLYRFTSAIEAAVDVAIGLGRPLLVAGEPGCGKTELGYAVARRLGVESLYFFSTKSSSEARELFYTYDAVGRFREAQLAAVQGQGKSAKDVATPGDFIRYQALGRAILDSHTQVDVKNLLKGRGHVALPAEPRRSVVVIDEIDKAPRDFTNDLLREIEDLSFRVPELSNSPEEGDGTPPGSRIPFERRPIIIATSNEESQMPDAFLRRCIFLAIEFPDPAVLREILDLHLEKLDGGDNGTSERASLLILFDELRKGGMQKKPGIAELIDAGHVMTKRPAGVPFGEWLVRLAPALVKLKTDLPVFSRALAALSGPPLASQAE
ncbi:MoxR family ATPase [Bradyrhizobium sp. CCGB01]|uniref:AAA family ATPase n=1 Tax=Bradyrhizobium sp. CCGB01 TaxID=2949634 RepID=UPI0020B3344D|nr:MoxR family ATPase [Bradyrhizobium sp. CCGB01]MCP3404466.1 MoxR family ATPase [Bradyrhizobium sp. CCGB01]